MVLVKAGRLGGSKGILCVAEHFFNHNCRHLVTIHIPGYTGGRCAEIISSLVFASYTLRHSRAMLCAVL